MRLSMAVLLALACLLTACESMGRSGGSLKDSIRTRSIERERLHDAAAIKAAYDKAGDDADETILLFLNACLLVEEDKDAGNRAIAYMSRPNDQWKDGDSPTGVKLSQMASEGWKRIAADPAIIRSYCGGEGADFKLADPEQVKLSIKSTQKVGSDSYKYFLWSKGKDNASPVTIRRDGGHWYVEEWSSLQGGVTGG